MHSFVNYTTAIDIWAVGCILAELLGGKPIFKGRDYVNQLNRIFHCLGTPSEDTLRRVGSPRAQDYIRSVPIKPRMLCFDLAERIRCEATLNHPYLQVWHDPADEPVCESQFDFSFEEKNLMDGMKRLIIEEVQSFRAEVRQ
ncbi:hypothetical protein AZE42_12188 [Rhizopogon vesiculosus]|uniref:Protein kinase domain-containing protein n=1 Tax=Rhizopogon vesiculosus TaxID=180088 RepID=A0A1J8PXK8_9AGAM|nr:hypothetical protein AZE42_12188 [Rhizopogon vesiculosus]